MKTQRLGKENIKQAPYNAWILVHPSAKETFYLLHAF